MAKSNKTNEDVKIDVAQLKRRIAVLKEQARERGMAFYSLNEEQLTKKVSGETSNSPFIFSAMWQNVGPGSTARYVAYVQNCDPETYDNIFVTIFFGLGDLFSIEQGWIGRDKRWPEFSSIPMYVFANSSESIEFTFTVPSVPSGTYQGTAVLWSWSWNEIGSVLDRSSFYMTV